MRLTTGFSSGDSHENRMAIRAGERAKAEREEGPTMAKGDWEQRKLDEIDPDKLPSGAVRARVAKKVRQAMADDPLPVFHHQDKAAAIKRAKEIDGYAIWSSGPESGEPGYWSDPHGFLRPAFERLVWSADEGEIEEP